MEKSCAVCSGTGVLLSENSLGKVRRESCPVCGGNGVNPNYRSTVCLVCRTPMGYHKNQSMIPNVCPDCRIKHHREDGQQNKNALYIPPDRFKMCAGLDGSHCKNLVHYNESWEHIPTICKQCREEVEQRKIQGAHFFESELIPQGWEGSIKERAVSRFSGLLVFEGKGTGGADYLVSWDRFGLARWHDNGLPNDHELRNRDPR